MNPLLMRLPSSVELAFRRLFDDAAGVDLGDLFVEGAEALGGTNVVGPQAGSGRLRGSLLRATLKDKRRPEVLSLSFQASPVLPTGTVIPAASTHLLLLSLKWGSPKGTGAVVCDYRHGMRVSLECSFVSVDVVYAFQPVALSAEAGPDYQVGCSIGLGSAGENRLTRTLQSESLATGVTGTALRVPGYAHSVEVQSSDDPLRAAPSDFLLAFLASDQAGARVISRTILRDAPVTLPNGCEAIQITNNGPNTAVHTPIFHLRV